jgi:hypothetical protein
MLEQVAESGLGTRRHRGRKERIAVLLRAERLEPAPAAGERAAFGSGARLPVPQVAQGVDGHAAMMIRFRSRDHPAGVPGLEPPGAAA